MIQPHELPITPKRWTVTTSRSGRLAGNGHQQVLAAIMPRPALSGHEPCAGDDRFTADTDRMHPAERVALERDLRALCYACPVLLACQEWAIAHDKYNYTGAMSAQDREAARLNRGQLYVEPHHASVYGLDDDLFAPPRRCKNGHEISLNTAHLRRTRRGKLEPICSVCYDQAQDAAIAARAAKRKAS